MSERKRIGLVPAPGAALVAVWPVRPPRPPKPPPPVAAPAADGPREIVLTFALPPRVLEPNRSQRNTRWKSSERKRYRAACKTAATYQLMAWCHEQHVKQWEPMKLVVVGLAMEYCYNHARRLDPDNAIASTKGLMDGLTDAGVWVDDGPSHLSYGAIQVTKHKPDCICGGRVVMTLTEQERKTRRERHDPGTRSPG